MRAMIICNTAKKGHKQVGGNKEDFQGNQKDVGMVVGEKSKQTRKGL